MKLALVVSEVHRSLWLFKPHKKYDAAQSSTSMELWVLMDLNLYASDNIGKAQFEKVYFVSVCKNQTQLRDASFPVITGIPAIWLLC